MEHRTYQVPVGVTMTMLRGLELRRRHFEKADIGIDMPFLVRVLDEGTVDEAGFATIQKALQTKPEGGGYRPEKPGADVVKYLSYGGDPATSWIERVCAVDEADVFKIDVKVEKVDTNLGIVFGYAMVCTEDGEDYYDLQQDHIPEGAMLEATAKYMEGQRIAKDMHEGDACGQVVFGFPVTAEIAKSLDMVVKRTGFIVGMKPDDAGMLEKFANGEYTGFSIGGRRIKDTEVA